MHLKDYCWLVIARELLLGLNVLVDKLPPKKFICAPLKK
jgi:hypothetical protein